MTSGYDSITGAKLTVIEGPAPVEMIVVQAEDGTVYSIPVAQLIPTPPRGAR